MMQQQEQTNKTNKQKSVSGNSKAEDRGTATNRNPSTEEKTKEKLTWGSFE